MRQRILIVEDDAALARVLRDNLAFEGFDVECVGDGAIAVGKAREIAPDLILLDIMLPGRNGFDLCRILGNGGKTPIIILSARGEKADKLRGLNLGADDYVTKPFDLKEVLARVHGLLRRTRRQVESLTLGRITINFRNMTAADGTRQLDLTHREFELLRYLAERQDCVVYRHLLLQDVWGYSEEPNTRAVDHAIVRLRKKIEPDPRHPRFIRTVHGGGYCLTVGSQDDAEGTHADRSPGEQE